MAIFPIPIILGAPAPFEDGGHLLKVNRDPIFLLQHPVLNFVCPCKDVRKVKVGEYWSLALHQPSELPGLVGYSPSGPYCSGVERC